MAYIPSFAVGPLEIELVMVANVVVMVANEVVMGEFGVVMVAAVAVTVTTVGLKGNCKHTL